jgi:hypothetical protein
LFALERDKLLLASGYLELVVFSNMDADSEEAYRVNIHKD